METLFNGCLRCGRCCYDGVVRCPHLRDVPGQFVHGRNIIKTRCEVWKKRNVAIRNHSRLFINGHVCLLRSEDKRIIDGCPLNQITTDIDTIKQGPTN
jgi:hypothetical protein